MDQDPFQNEQELRKKLDEYHIDIPAFPMKPNKWTRFIHFLASPAKNPFESLLSTANRLFLLKVVPFAGATVFTLIQLFLNSGTS